MIEKESMNVSISKAVYNVKAILEVHLGFSKKETGNAITVRTSTSNGELCVTNVSIPNEKIKARTTDEVKEVVLIMASQEEVVDIVNLSRIQVKEDTLGITGMIVITSAQVG